jgi:hypothetical protein
MEGGHRTRTKTTKEKIKNSLTRLWGTDKQMTEDEATELEEELTGAP